MGNCVLFCTILVSIQQFCIISACVGIKGSRLMGKGLGDNYREGTGRGAVGPGGASTANMPPLC